MGGLGDGVPPGTFTDTWGNPVNPANFTLPAGTPGGVKLGHDGRHLFKTIMTGVGGTPMPPFAGTFTPAQTWDIVHYVQSLRVNAQIVALKQAGLTQPEQQAGFCTSTIPWLRAACTNVMLPIISFCSAGGSLETQANTAKIQLADSRAKLWGELSEAADRQQIDQQVLQADQPRIPALARLLSKR
jgi:hypothetical protein